MRIPLTAKLGLLLSLSAVPAHGQTGGPAADRADGRGVASGLAEILSLATFGMVTTQEQAAQLTPSGSDTHVRLPLVGFLTPADAAVNAIVHPLDGGMWDVVSLTFPSTGTVRSAIRQDGTGGIAYSIGEQATHLRIDPVFARPSSFAANLGDIKLHSDQSGNRSDQVFERYVMEGSLSADASGLVNIASHGHATNWHLTAQAVNGVAMDSLVRTISGQFSLEGLDRAKGTRLLAAARALAAGAQTIGPQTIGPQTGGAQTGGAQTGGAQTGGAQTGGAQTGGAQTGGAGQPPGVTQVQRDEMRALVDAIPGLLGKFQAEETLDDIHFTVRAANSGTLGRMHVNMAGGSVNDRLNARMDIAMDEFSMAGLPADTAGYIPRHVILKPVLAGVRTPPLIALLRAATEADADFGLMQSQLTALFGDADAHVGIESLTFDSGPLRVAGSARVAPRADGQFGAEIHVSATGLDALIAEAQGKPALQQVLPMIFMAKGMGRQEAGGLVWDIVMGDGPPTVNGMPIGQKPPRSR